MGIGMARTTKNIDPCICLGAQSFEHANVLSEKINFSALGGLGGLELILSRVLRRIPWLVWPGWSGWSGWWKFTKYFQLFKGKNPIMLKMC